MTSPALICPTCRAAFDLEAAAESNAPLRECCYAAIKVAQAHCIVANASQTLARAIAQARPFASTLSDEAVTSKDPKVRAAAVAWRIARGRNREAERWVHAENVGPANWLCGEARNDFDPQCMPQRAGPVTCPYCLGAALLRKVPT